MKGGRHLRRKPPWVIKKLPSIGEIIEVRHILRELGLHTVCEEAMCPNMGECYSARTATFLIMGDVCTRNCAFCAVKKGNPRPLDEGEPERVARAAGSLQLRHVVITSVTRDDLPGGGARHFARTVREVKRLLPGSTVEVLVPDFKGDVLALQEVLCAGPDVIGHNIETVPRLYKRIRPKADYERSLKLLADSKKADSHIRTKSGLMLGLGENRQEVISVLRDLRRVNCDFVTIGQYLRPTMAHHPVERYVGEDEFEEYGRVALELGFKAVASAPMVRSSYMAREMLEKSGGIPAE